MARRLSLYQLEKRRNKRWMDFEKDETCENPERETSIWVRLAI
jgi:hypothetical protein